MSITGEFARLLDDLGFGTYPATATDVDGTIFLAQLPAEPDEAIAIARYPAGESDSALGYDEIRFQVRVRGPRHDAEAPEDTAQAIYDALHGMRSRYLPGGTYLVHLLGVQGGPIPLRGQDQHQRTEYVINFRAGLRRQTAHRE